MEKLHISGVSLVSVVAVLQVEGHSNQYCFMYNGSDHHVSFQRGCPSDELNPAPPLSSVWHF